MAAASAAAASSSARSSIAGRVGRAVAGGRLRDGIGRRDRRRGVGQGPGRVVVRRLRRRGRARRARRRPERDGSRRATLPRPRKPATAATATAAPAISTACRGPGRGGRGRRPLPDRLPSRASAASATARLRAICFARLPAPEREGVRAMPRLLRRHRRGLPETYPDGCAGNGAGPRQGRARARRTLSRFAGSGGGARGAAGRDARQRPAAAARFSSRTASQISSR